jgi:hypothetical protein
MRRPDHADALEHLAAQHNISPLTLVEWHLERAAIREYEAGLNRAEAERLAVEDIRHELEGGIR